MEFKEAFKKERRFIWLISALFALGGGSVLAAIANLWYGAPTALLLGVPLVGAAVWLTIRHRKQTLTIYPDADAATYETLFDRYARRTVNWILVAFWAVFSLILKVVTLGVNSKADEVVESLLGNVFLLEIVAFFLE